MSIDRHRAKVMKKDLKLTIKSLMSGNKGASQFVTHFINKILKVLFTLLTKFVLHFLGATRVSLRTYTKMIT